MVEKNEITEATAQLLKIESLVEQANKKHNMLMGQINNAQATYEKHVKNSQEVEKIVKLSQEKLDGIEKKTLIAKEVFKTEIKKEEVKGSEKSALTSEITILRNNKAKLIDDIVKTHKEATEIASGNATTVKTKLVNIQKEIQEAESYLKDIETETTVLKQDNDKALKLLQKREAQSRDLHNSIVVKTIKLEKLKGQLHQTSTKITANKKQVEETQSSVDAVINHEKQLKEIIPIQQKEIKELDSQIDQKKKEYTKATERIIGISEREETLKQKEQYIKEKYKRAGIEY